MHCSFLTIIFLCCFFIPASRFPPISAGPGPLPDSCLPEFLTTQMMDKLCRTRGYNHRIKDEAYLICQLNFYLSGKLRMFKCYLWPFVLVQFWHQQIIPLYRPQITQILSERDLLSISMNLYQAIHSFINIGDIQKATAMCIAQTNQKHNLVMVPLTFQSLVNAYNRPFSSKQYRLHFACLPNFLDKVINTIPSTVCIAIRYSWKQIMSEK